MRLLYLDQLRKIRKNLFNFISLSILVVIIALTFTAVKSSIRRLDENYDNYLQEQQVEDFYFNMGEVDVNFLGATAILNLCTELDVLYDCYVAFAHPDDPIYTNNLNIIINQGIVEHPEVYEELIDEFVDDFKEDYDYTIEKSNVVNVIDEEYIYKFMSITESINIPYIVEGELPVNDFEIAIFPEFAEANNINIGDSYTINNKDYLVTAFYYSPEFMFPIFSLSVINYEPEFQTLVLCNMNTMEDLDHFIFVKYLVQGDLTQIFGDFGYDTMQSGDLSLLGKNMQLVEILMPREINFRIIALPTEINNANAFIDIFLPLFIFFIVILLLVFMKRYIDKNQDDIKTLHAIGYKNNEIARAIIIYPFFISLTSIIGYLLGLLVSNKLFEMYSSRYLFPKAGFSIDFDLILYSVIIPIILITVINYIFIIYNLNKKSKTIKKIKLRLFKFTTLKTVLTTFILFLTVSVMITFGLNGNSMFTSFIETTKLGNNYAEMANLQYMTNSDHLDTYEEYTKTAVKITEVNSREVKTNQSTTLYGINSDNELKLLIDNNIENNLLLNDGVIVSDYLQTKLDLRVGDTITFEVGGVIITEEVVGISNELIENNFYTTKEKLNSYFNLNNSYYNGLYLTNYTYSNPYITSRIDYQNSLDEFTAILNISSLILNFLLVLSIGLSLFIFGLIIINYFKDNRFEIAILKSVGYNNYEINKKYLLIVYIILVITYISSIPITMILLEYMMTILMENIGFKLILEFSYLNILFGFIVLNIIFTVIVIYSTKYYDKINISELIKHGEI